MMTNDKFTLFASSLLVANSVHVSDNDGNPIATFKMGGDAAAMTELVFTHSERDLSLGVHFEDSEWCLGGIMLLRDIEDHSGEQGMFIVDYSKQMRPFIPDNQCDAMRVANGG